MRRYINRGDIHDGIVSEIGGDDLQCMTDIKKVNETCHGNYCTLVLINVTGSCLRQLLYASVDQRHR